MSNLYYYYVAFHVINLVDWHHHLGTKLSVQLESIFLSIPLTVATWLNYLPSGMPSHPTISPTLKMV